ncbi:MAG: hypothetical protein HY055_17145 [Magnetospirillum sp.]|nr:hypothetical protein [Magnetospirillum sp.]
MKSVPAVALALGLCACSSPDHVLFVTSTNRGINVDTSTQTASIGYDRTEGFIGPAYPETGAIPEVTALVYSNAQFFAPQAAQIYATGEAASDFATTLGQVNFNAGQTAACAAPVATSPIAALPTVSMKGQRRIMVFGTTSTIGFKLGFSGASAAVAVPESIVFGYKRREMSVLPLNSELANEQQDHYGSVMASVNLDSGGATLSTESIKLSQFFATGSAARTLAGSNIVCNLAQRQMTRMLGATTP